MFGTRRVVVLWVTPRQRPIFSLHFSMVNGLACSEIQRYSPHMVLDLSLWNPEWRHKGEGTGDREPWQATCERRGENTS